MILQNENDLFCVKCQIGLEQSNVTFSYLGHHFSAEVLRCPICGQLYLSEDMVRGKIAQVEELLEEK